MLLSKVKTFLFPEGSHLSLDRILCSKTTRSFFFFFGWQPIFQFWRNTKKKKNRALEKTTAHSHARSQRYFTVKVSVLEGTVIQKIVFGHKKVAEIMVYIDFLTLFRIAAYRNEYSSSDSESRLSHKNGGVRPAQCGVCVVQGDNYSSTVLSRLQVCMYGERTLPFDAQHQTSPNGAHVRGLERCSFTYRRRRAQPIWPSSRLATCYLGVALSQVGV